MTPDDYQRITETFLRLCERPAAERTAAMEELQQQDPDFHKAIEAMLRQDDEDDSRFRSNTDETCRPTSKAGHMMFSSMARGEELSEDRYKLTRLHATGGMGRVWLARDNAIGRNVALKELRPETPSAPGIWNRFLNEAKVTGQLEHPGIVPVYEVDADDSDRPFYTMRFVKGQTLHDAIRDFTTLRTNGKSSPMGLRDLITALIGVANAIGYAHSRGVLHRDLKGQNVVLGDYGEVIVLDWGLACIVGTAEVDDDQLPVSGSGVSEQTNAGQVIGTPAYMSPEQALGQPEKMNAQTDVFGLGGILYEILTGQAPFKGPTVLETLEKAKACNPASPRLIWADAPKPLEAICLRALSKDQAERYDSAIEFADDLRRWQADESVSAYQDSLSVRISRWARRHRTMVVTAAALSVMAIVGLSASTILISQEQVRTAAAQTRAEANLAKAREAVQRMLTEVGDERLKNIPQMEKLRETLLQEALEFNKGFLLESDDPEIRKETALAHGNVASIYQMLGKSDEALNSWQHGLETLTELHVSDPNNQDYTRTLASSLLNAAYTQESLGLNAETEATSRKALELLEPLAKSKSVDDGILNTIASCQRTIGNARLATGESADAELWFEKSLKTYEQMSDDGQNSLSVLQNQSNVRLALGRLMVIAGRTKEARDQFNDMLRLTSTLVAKQPENHEFRELSAMAHQWLSDLDRSTGDRDLSRTRAIEALQIRENLTRDFPHIADYQATIVSAYGSIAISFAESGNPTEAEKYFVKGAEAARKLATSFPSVPMYRNQAATSIRVAAVFYFNTRRIEEAKVELIDAVSRFQALAAEYPDTPMYRMDLAIAMDTLARCHQFQEATAEARKLYEQSIAIYETLLSEQFDVVKVRHKLAQDYRSLGELAASEKDMEVAETLLRKALSMHRETVAAFPEIAEHHRWVAVGLDKLADFLLLKGGSEPELEEALKAADESLQIRRRLLNENPKWFQPQVEISFSLMLKGKIQQAMKNVEGAAATFESAAAYCADLLTRFPNDSNVIEDHAGSHELRARLYETAGQLKEAIAELGYATAIRREHVAKFPDEQRAKTGLRANLADVAEVQLLANDHDAALMALKESLALPADMSWETSLRSAELLAQCSQRPATEPSTDTPPKPVTDVAIADLAIAQLLVSLKAGHPNPSQVAASETFAPLTMLESWKAVTEFVAAAKP